MSRGCKDMKVYQLAYRLAMEVFDDSKHFPLEERFAITGQIRRSSRGVCTNLAEAYRKRRYPLHFVSKLTDSDAECEETTVHLDFAKDCGYITPDRHRQMVDSYAEVGSMLGSMIMHPERFCDP